MLKSSFRLSFALLVCAAFAGCTATVADEPAQATGQAQEDLSLVLGRKSTRIAVVGAGPSGLTAADTLKSIGYTNVTVFEKEPRVGGKVFSLRAQGQVTELGAVFASPDYSLVLDYAKKYNVPYETYSTTRYILDENGRQTSESFLTSRYSQLELLASTLAYGGVQALFAQTNLNGFAFYPKDLELPFIEFARKYKIEPIAELMRSVMVGFGYPYYETTPAMYYMKLLPWLVKIGGEKGLAEATYYTFPTGYQSVWEGVASGLNVKLNSKVTKIERRKNRPVVITINGTDKYEFDQVIISAPLNKVSTFMDLTPKEEELFDQVESERYVVTLFTSANLPRSEVMFFHTNAFPSRINHTVAWGSRDATPVNIAYQIADRVTPIDGITGVLAQDVADQGGTFGSVLVRQEWEDYFPHVSPEVAQDGFYDDVELLQGDNNTFYVGGALSFETVEHSARYAKQLVQLHFVPPLF
jgi:predicted NAD/FAD-dependent oxidoreductase